MRWNVGGGKDYLYVVKYLCPRSPLVATRRAMLQLVSHIVYRLPVLVSGGYRATHGQEELRKVQEVVEVQ